MMNTKKLILSFFILIFELFLLSCQNNSSQNSTPSSNSNKFTQDAATQNVIYGQDDRLDYFEVSDEKILKLSQSTVAFFDSELLHYDQIFDRYEIDNQESSVKLCPGEKYKTQPTWAFCSGSLIDKDLVLTAGHCIYDSNTCKQTKIVFDYKLNSKNDKINYLKGENVFSCSQIIYSTQKNNAADFAIIKLDREVPNRKPITLSQNEINFSDSLLVIGHPWGWPTKITSNGKIRNNTNSAFFTATLDTFSGNSGSAVFNQNTLEIVGVLSRGEHDFTLQNSCHVAKFCKENECRGEDVTRISEVLKVLNK